jgi:DNA-binding NtrC family response regulator
LTELGKGTKFEVYLPMLEEPAFECDKREDETTCLVGNETILIVDDEESVRDLGHRILTRAGYTVLTASNARQGLAIYSDRHQEIALVILDLVMPGMGGKECLETLMAVDPLAKVLVATGLPAEGQTTESLGTAAAGFVTKPFDINQLLKSVRTALDVTQEPS